MRKILAAAALLLAPAARATQIQGWQIQNQTLTSVHISSSDTGTYKVQSLNVVSTAAAGALAVTYGLSAGTAAIAGSLTASSGTFTASGNAQGSVLTSSSIVVTAGMVTAPWFVGPLRGNADTATSATTTTNLAGGASGSLPYQSAVNATSLLAASVNGYALQQAAGVPSWVASVSSATNLAGGAAGSVPYQSAANTTSLLASSVNGYALQQTAGVPAWVAAVSSATNIAAGAAGQIPMQSAANVTTFLPAMADGGMIIGAGTSVIATTGTLTGTANRVTVTRNAAGILLSGPQDLGTGNSPTFSALTLTNALTVGNGGTGAQTLAAHGVVVGNGTSAVTVLPAMGSGGIVIGNGTSLDPSTGTVAGTASEITVTKGVAGLTLATAGQTTTCGASQGLTGATFTGGVASGGSCSASGAGDVITTATQTFSGANTFTSTVTVNSTMTVTNTLNAPYGVYPSTYASSTAPQAGWGNVWALSIDGTTQSSGTLVAVSFPANTTTTGLQFTSTTTLLNVCTGNIFPGVLLETCAPGSVCRVGVAGVFLVHTQNSLANGLVEFGSTRGNIQNEAQYDCNTVGVAIGPNPAAAGAAMIRLGR